MLTRTLEATSTGPVTIDARLLEHAGIVSIHAVAGCDRATLTLRTADDEGPAAEAVQKASLNASATTLSAHVQGTGSASSDGTTTIRRGNRTTVVQHATVVTGTMVGLQFNNQGNTISSFDAAAPLSSPIEITAIVPEGTSVIGHTQTADITVAGAILNVRARTQTGHVRTGHVAKVEATTQAGDLHVQAAAYVHAKTQSGDIHLDRADTVDASTMSGDIQIANFGGTARLTTMSGDITVHATAGGDLNASSMSGDIIVTATDSAHADGLDVQAHTMTGDIRAPRRR